MITSLCIGLVGLVVASSTMNIAARYIVLKWYRSPALIDGSKRVFARFLMAQSIAACITFLAWTSPTFPRPPSKQAVVIALIHSFGQLGNIAGSYIWPKTRGETYRCSLYCNQWLAIVMIPAFRAHLKGLDEQAGRQERERGLPKGYGYLL